jgi:tight adherence protein C
LSGDPVEDVLVVLVFLLGAGLTFGAYLLYAGGKMRIEERLRAAAPADPERTEADLVLGNLTPALAGQIPMAAGDSARLEGELRAAGYYGRTALMEYAAVRAVLVLLPLLAGAVGALMTETARQAFACWGASLTAALLGYSVPRVVLYFKAQARKHAIERGLPAALDMLTLCLGAGLNVLVSLRRVAEELHTAHPVLAYELELVSRHAELRTLEFALARFADRVGVPQVRNIAALLSQSQNLGSDAVNVLREYADNLRVNLRQRADEMANKAPLKLLVPAYMLAIGAGILIVSPTVLEFVEFRKLNLVNETVNQAREALRRPDAARQEATPSPPGAPDDR